MDAFSFLSVLLSIILGLGITQLLAAAERLIRAHARPHLPAAAPGARIRMCVVATVVRQRRVLEILAVTNAVAVIVYIAALFAQLR